ncbi:hypothetical protein W03_18290 [Nitrosomonas sp. PY1]|nr:hypothetical protein W03_18290 [Nitrosomonas sp. PY1]
MLILNVLSLLGLLLFVTSVAYAQQHPLAGGGSAKDFILKSALNAGRMHQFIERCGASSEVLVAYKESFDANMAGGEKTYRELGINIQAEFDKGRGEGDSEFVKIANDQSRDAMCNEAIGAVTRLINKSEK